MLESAVEYPNFNQSPSKTKEHYNEYNFYTDIIALVKQAIIYDILFQNDLKFCRNFRSLYIHTDSTRTFKLIQLSALICKRSSRSNVFVTSGTDRAGPACLFA